FLAPLEIEVSGFIQRAHVSGAVPTLLIDNFVPSASLPIPRRHSAPANQYLSILRQLHLAPRQHFPDRPFPQLEGMVHADERRRLRQPISLDRGISQPPPEFFGLRIQRRASANKRPELPPKLPPNPAKDPPPVQKVLSFRCPEPPPKLLDLPTVLEIAFDLLFQRLQNSRYAHQH